MGVLALVICKLIGADSSKMDDTNAENAVNDSGHFFSDVSFRTNTKSGKNIQMHSSRICETADKKHELKDMSASMKISQEHNAFLTADVVHEIGPKEHMYELVGNVKLDISSYNANIKTDCATLDLDKNIVWTKKDTYIKKDNYNIFAKLCTFDINNKFIQLNTNVTVKTQNNSLSAAKILAYFQKKDINKLYKIDCFGKKVVILYSDNKKKYEVRAENISVFFDKNGTLDYVQAKDGVFISMDSIIIHADSGIKKGQKLFLNGNVVISDENGDICGDCAEFDVITRSVEIKRPKGVMK